MNNKFNRNSAFSMNLSDNSENSNDEVQYLIKLQDSFYAFANNYITKILPAESIDSQNLHPETRHSDQKTYSIGCANLWVEVRAAQLYFVRVHAFVSPSMPQQ
jgi:hypothetical protein